MFYGVKIMLCIECQNVVFIRLLFVSCLSMIKHFYSSSITVYLYDFVLKSKDEPFDYGIGITCDFIDDSYFQVFICTYHYLVSRNNHAYLPYPPLPPPPPWRERDSISTKKERQLRKLIQWYWIQSRCFCIMKVFAKKNIAIASECYYYWSMDLIKLSLHT